MCVPTVGMTTVKFSKSEESNAIFLERRQAALQRYLNRVAKHPVLSRDADFIEFLENPEEVGVWVCLSVCLCWCLCIYGLFVCECLFVCVFVCFVWCVCVSMVCLYVCLFVLFGVC